MRIAGDSAAVLWGSRPWARGALAILAFGLLTAAPARAQDATFDFAVSKIGETSVLWRVDRLSGEVGMCRFEQANGEEVGALKCANRGPGAGVQEEPGPYGLKAGQFEDESAMFRVNPRTGSASLCYDIKKKDGCQVVCTEPNR